MITALDISGANPQGWAILSAIYLSLGRETDAEKAGKTAIAQCPELKMTWPKLRSTILKYGLKQGTDWKSPRKVLLNDEATSVWGDTLAILGRAPTQEIEMPVQIQEARSIEENHDIEPEKAFVQEIKEFHSKRPELPSISSRKVDGVTKFELEKLRPDLEGRDRITEEIQSGQKRQALPIFSSKEVVDATKGYDKEPVPEVTKPKEIPEIAVVPESASSWFRIGEFQMKKGDWEGAEKAYRRGLALEPENSDAWTQIGNLLMKRRDYKEAEDALRVATKHEYKNVDAWYLLGVCLQQQDNWNEALIVLKTASNLDQNRADIWMKLGESEFHIGQYQDAARSFLRTLRIVPDQKDAMFYLAMCMERRGNRQHALSLYIKLLNMGDLSSDMLERIAGAFERLNRPGETREARRRAALARKMGS
jgi:cytochrome c-type biogenesis protein CcmH/NrfG